MLRLTSSPAANLRITDRGSLKAGHFADVVVFDPRRIQDHATFEKPHQYSTGMVHVWVNGTPVLKDGEHTGAKPGRAVRSRLEEMTMNGIPPVYGHSGTLSRSALRQRRRTV